MNVVVLDDAARKPVGYVFSWKGKSTGANFLHLFNP